MSDDRDTVPWFPESLRGRTDRDELRERFSYVVIEEIVDATVLLLRWRWPLADGRGRLYWPADEEQPAAAATVAAAVVVAQLYEPNGIERHPRPGDVFATVAAARGWRGGRRVADLRALFDGVVYDISADAREAAKLAYQGSVASVRNGGRDGTELRALLDNARSHRAQRSAPELVLGPPQGRRGQR